jgi:uroporphyrinogen III methyltransferase/synthase
MSALSGKRVLVTRPRDQSAGLADALAARGAQPILLPTIEIRPSDDLGPLDRALDTLVAPNWIAFTSANAVAICLDRLATRLGTLPQGVRVAAVGSGTARALAARGVGVDFVPSRFTGEQLGRELEPVVGRRVLVPRAARGREELVAELRRRGAEVEDIPVYETLPAAADPDGLRELWQGVDAATFTSASTVENYVALLGERAARLLDDTLIACIGPVTAEAARSLGLPVHVQPVEHTIPGLVAALEHAVSVSAVRESGA